MSTFLPTKRFSGFLRTLLLVLVLSAGHIMPALATHFRYANISWQALASDPTGRTIQFKVSVGYRITFFQSIGSTAVGQIISNADTFSFGDGASQSTDYTITSFNASEDYFFGEATFTHTYATTGNKSTSVSGCCRISELENNADESYFIPAVVNVGMSNRPPLTTLNPIINVATNQAAASILVPASDADGDALTYSLATSAEMNGIGFAQPAGLTINATTGQLTFNTVGKANNNLYNAVVKISDGKTSTFADFIIKIAGTNNPPTFAYGVGLTPPNGGTLPVVINTPFSFMVRASDTDAADVVTLNAVGVPVGATFSPPLSVTGSPAATTTFNWTPTALGTFIVNFTATDRSGGQAATSVIISVVTSATVTPPPPPPTPTPGGPFAITLPAGYTCTTGAIIFNTTGGDGTTIEYRAIGVCDWTTNPNQVIDLAVRNDPNSQPITMQARQSGVMVMLPFDWRGFCAGVVLPPPPTPTPGGPFAITLPAGYTCATGAMVFNTTGGNGTTIEYRAIGVCDWTTNPNQVIDLAVRNDPNSQPITMQARQSGVMVMLPFDWRGFCAAPSSSRMGAAEPALSLNVRVLGNPSRNEAVEVEIMGAEGGSLQLTMVDQQGRTVGNAGVERAGTVERRVVSLGRTAGIYFLRVQTPTQTKTVKVMKQ